MKEHEKARRWRERRGWTTERLSGLSGYSREAIWWMEQGLTPSRPGKKSGPIGKTVWTRYRNACAGVDAANRGKAFNW